MTRLRGRAPRGQRLVAAIPHGHWKTSTFVAALRTSGLTAPLIVDGATEGIYTVLSRKDVAGDIRFQELRKVHSAMLYSHRRRDWKGAVKRSSCADHLARLSVLKRCLI
jgi:hypothetical protein